ncbi:MAG: hypothetical protein ACOYJQ_12460 [Pseudochelatococcus sp.]|jgi:hypothetical protein|uniref:hypothetical protein n=1 Tax=Pseudochelatococcus sp. TaxID=2020869 RepID=UPI003D93A472
MARQPSNPENPDKENESPAEGKTGEAEPARTPGADTSSRSDPLSDLRKAHSELTDLLDTIKKKTPDRQKENIQQFKQRWLQHSLIEEELLVPQIESRNIDSPELLEGEVKRDLAKLLIVNLDADEAEKAAGAATLRVVDALVRQLVEAEEKPGTGLFARIQSFNVPNLAEKISRRKEELEQGDLPDPVLHHLSIEHFTSPTNEQESNVTNRERDAQGRFVSEDDRNYGGRRQGDDDRNNRRYDDDRRGGSYSRSRDDDDRRYGRHDERRSPDRDRDYDEDRRGRSYSRSRDDDDRRYGRRDDEGYSRDRGQGGWFGDPEGHAEAARRGWDERRSSDRDYDEDRRGRSYSRSRDDDDRRYGRRDDEGYSRDRGQGGWFGDPEGHAEAARRGWDERRSSDRDYDEDRRGRSYSRSRDDDDRRYGRRDDEGYSRDRGQGGWFGDPQGHAEAARRGWRNRDDY